MQNTEQPALILRSLFIFVSWIGQDKIFLLRIISKEFSLCNLL